MLRPEQLYEIYTAVSKRLKMPGAKGYPPNFSEVTNPDARKFWVEFADEMYLAYADEMNLNYEEN